MKIYLLASLIIILSSCFKTDDTQFSKEVLYASVSFGCNCQESATKISGSTTKNLAEKFAPLVKFDRAAPDYPTSVEDI